MPIDIDGQLKKIKQLYRKLEYAYKKGLISKENYHKMKSQLDSVLKFFDIAMNVPKPEPVEPNHPTISSREGIKLHGWHRLEGVWKFSFKGPEWSKWLKVGDRLPGGDYTVEATIRGSKPKVYLKPTVAGEKKGLNPVGVPLERPGA